MKILWVILILMGLSGCAGEATFETVADVMVTEAPAQPKKVKLQLPKEVAAPVMDTEAQQIFVSEGYEIMVEKRPSGDLQGTVLQLSGYMPDKLTVLSTDQGEYRKHSFVWSCTGEQGDRLGKAVVLDDGNYHYCLSILWDAALTEEKQTQWDSVFASFSLVED
ncbi:MAG: hypothetical protein J6V25_00725 [Oscillospiraceae bacterium]|nr:hypothetical protein [Oscillospiraceae bacterium]